MEEQHVMDHVQDDSGAQDDVQTPSNPKIEKIKSKGKRGVIYLSTIPEGMNPRNIRTTLSRFGEMDRIYLEPEKTRRGVVISYKEGWVEYIQKKVAKRVAQMLNGTQVGGKKKTAYHDAVWTMKYLHRFKWNHLTEHMNHEKSQKDQRLRFEVTRAKRDAEFYVEQARLSKRHKKNDSSGGDDLMAGRESFYEKRQRISDEKIRRDKGDTQRLEDEILTRIFT